MPSPNSIVIFETDTFFDALSNPQFGDEQFESRSRLRGYNTQLRRQKSSPDQLESAPFKYEDPSMSRCTTRYMPHWTSRSWVTFGDRSCDMCSKLVLDDELLNNAIYDSGDSNYDSDIFYWCEFCPAPKPQQGNF